MTGVLRVLTALVAVAAGASSNPNWPCTGVVPRGKYTQAACEAECQTMLSACKREQLADNNAVFACVIEKVDMTKCEFHTTSSAGDAPKTSWYKKGGVVAGASAGLAALVGLGGYGLYRRRNNRAEVQEAENGLTDGAYYNKEGVLVDQNGNPVDTEF
ncbi:putative transmembrane protein [Gregarina niphandrodes]|uniref:Transmembrane protein n=1 Tax=Gregarina niphandrodes TaxID=110365 RepID=A0A023B5V4_GRENI|nr:putative transmembrane protein [Gregarina niphandrodes]EZG63299.1 putative transmembrane protein [Gregarina niphandrodes]|eukprot:XP_011130691.1 putative transmembrane protein [Gregarina niphandrodes]